MILDINQCCMEIFLAPGERVKEGIHNTAAVWLVLPLNLLELHLLHADWLLSWETTFEQQKDLHHWTKLEFTALLPWKGVGSRKGPLSWLEFFFLLRSDKRWYHTLVNEMLFLLWKACLDLGLKELSWIFQRRVKSELGFASQSMVDLAPWFWPWLYKNRLKNYGDIWMIIQH